jgi:hypothetical protein
MLNIIFKWGGKKMNKYLKAILCLAFLFILLRLTLFCGDRINCKASNCGEGCIYGECVDASYCTGCIIYYCYNDKTQERENVACSYMAE